MTAEVEDGYSGEETGRLQLIWGEGFLSPGGPAEVRRILAGADIGGGEVLDVGSGAGGADLALVRDHGAASVVGVDVQKELVDLSTRLAAEAGLGAEIRYHLVDPESPLAFPDACFDVVFSKDAIIHIRDKGALYGEAFRVLRPGGRLLVSDWLRGHGEELTPQVEAFVQAAEHGFVMVSAADTATIVEQAGFVDVELSDRRSWYLGEATAELGRLRGPLRAQFDNKWGADAADAEIEFWEVLVDCLRTGALTPSHIRARKPDC